MKHPSVTSTLTGGFALMRKRAAVVIAGIVVFSLLQAGVQITWQRQFQDKLLSSLQAMTASEEQAAVLAAGIRMRDKGAVKRILNANPMVTGEFMRMNDIEKLQYMERHVFQAMGTLLPALVILIALLTLVSMLAVMYQFVAVVTQPKPSIISAFFRYVHHLTSFCLLAVWASIRSFSWIPIIGPVMAVYFLPRFIASPVLLLRDNVGVLHSVKESMKLSEGAYGHIVVTLLMIGICSTVLIWLIALIAEAVAVASYAASVTLGTVAYQAVAAYATACMAQLGMMLIDSKKKT